MDALPIELVTVIAVDSFDLFTTLLLVPTIGQRLCEQYPQLVAREKFIEKCYNPAMDRSCTYINGWTHSVDGLPAFVDSGCKKWYRNGKLHRINLPAVEHADGIKEWWINGCYQYSIYN